MGPILQSAIAAARRRQRGSGDGLLKLVLLEVGWALGQVLRPLRITIALVVALLVGVALGPRTPGPVLADGWRLGLAVALGLIALSVAHALFRRQRDASRDDLLYVLRLAVGVVLALVVVAFVTGSILAVVTGEVGEGPVAPTLDASLAIDNAVLLGGAVLLLAVLTTSVSTRLAVPGSLLFLGLGMLVGSDGLGLVALDDPALVQSIGVGALVIILFDGGLGTRGPQLRAGAGPGLALATVGVVVSVGVTALGAMALLDVPRREAWLLGAIVGSTDASAVFALLRRTPLRARPAAVLQLESGLNDPIAVLLTVVPVAISISYAAIITTESSFTFDEDFAAGDTSEARSRASDGGMPPIFQVASMGAIIACGCLVHLACHLAAKHGGGFATVTPLLSSAAE